MQIPDTINGFFEVGGGLLSWMNFYRLRRDKVVRGVDWRVTIFWSAFGFWNLIYYPVLGQIMSTLGGVVLTAANTAWVVLALKYRSK